MIIFMKGIDVSAMSFHKMLAVAGNWMRSMNGAVWWR